MSARRTLLSLPEEIIEHTLQFLPDDDSTVLDIGLVCKKLYRLSNSPLEWRSRCRRFRYWEPRHGYHQKLRHPRPAEIDWRSLYVERIYLHRRTTRLLNDIIASSINRIPRFNEIADIGYDAKDCLAEHANAPNDAEDVLARR
jgi:F-box protein 21